jgi:hypothetical protein
VVFGGLVGKWDLLYWLTKEAVLEALEVVLKALESMSEVPNWAFRALEEGWAPSERWVSKFLDSDVCKTIGEVHEAVEDKDVGDTLIVDNELYDQMVKG